MKIGGWQGKTMAIKAKKKMEAQKAAADTAAIKEKAEQQVANADPTSVSGRITQQMGADELAKGGISQDLIKGAKFGEAVLGPEGLGRIGEDKTMSAMEAQAAEMAKGYSSEEMLARKEKGLESISGSTSAQSRAAQAALARSGVKGQAAGAQLSNIAMSGIQAKGNLERDLLIDQRNAQMQGLGLQSNIHGQALESQKFDISQAAKEKDIALQAGLGFAQLGNTERSAALAREAQIEAARAGKQKCFVMGTKIRMQDNSLMAIEDITLADFVKEGGVVYSVSRSLVSEIYDYLGELVCGSHAVLEDDKWIRVKDSKHIVRLDGIFEVYNLCTENHVIISELGTVFADYDETDFASEINDKESLEVLNGKGSKVLEKGRGV